MNVRVALCQQEIKCFIFKKHLLLMWWDLYYHASLVSPNQLSLMLFIGPGKKKKKLLHALHLTWDQEYILIITFQFKDLHRVILQDNGLDSLKSVGWPMWTNQVTLQTVTITPDQWRHGTDWKHSWIRQWTYLKALTSTRHYRPTIKHSIKCHNKVNIIIEISWRL